MKCRRCSECQNSDHHWMDNMDWETESDPNYRCKHCPAVGVDCTECEEGLRNGKRCGACQGAGILQCGTDETEDELEDDTSCYHCGGKRYVITCPDDLCATSDSCMHGDGEEDCPVCNADGEHEWNC